MLPLSSVGSRLRYTHPDAVKSASHRPLSHWERSATHGSSVGGSCGGGNELRERRPVVTAAAAAAVLAVAATLVGLSIPANTSVH